MSFTVNTLIVPTGGAILLSISSEASAGYQGITVQRSSNGGSTWTQIFSGAPAAISDPLFRIFDIGENLPTPLLGSGQYMYWVQDATTPSISTMVGPYSPVSQINVLDSLTTESWRRLLSAGVSALAIPDGYKAPTFLYQMPLDATPPLPFITMNLDLVQQEEIPIGFSVPYEQFAAEALALSGIGSWSVQGLQKRRYSIYVVARSYQERDYYQNSIIGILYGLQQVLIPLNQNITFSYQASQGAIEKDSTDPGFYYAQIMADYTQVEMTTFSAQTGDFSGIIVQAISDITPTIPVSASGLVVAT